MTAPAVQDVAAACRRLSLDVHAVLAAAGHRHFEETGDGFDVLAPNAGDIVHIAVVNRREGPLAGCGGRQVTAQRLAAYQRTLAEAGYGVAALEDDGTALALIVTPTPDTAAEALEFAVEHRGR